MSMRIRLTSWGVLALCLSLHGLACGPTTEARDITTERRASGEFCGGIAGTPCPEGNVCVDDPRDDCDPKQGGADCGGICRKAKERRCTGSEPGLIYKSRDPSLCPTLPFTCGKDTTLFSNGCGCGCQEGNSCKYDDPDRTYVSTDPTECATILFLCVEGTVPFFDRCGCGCETAP
jgi:hypothetical protein